MTTGRIGGVGTLDRAARIVIGAAFLLGAVLCPWAAAQGIGMQIGFGVVATILFGTAALGVCPLYRMLGIGTG